MRSMRSILLCGVVFCSAAHSTPTSAQTVQQPERADPSKAATPDADNDIVVTGTLIRGLTAPTGAAVQDVDAQAIRATGATSALAVLNQTVPQLPTFNSLSVGTPGFGTPVTKIGLRGIGNTAGSSSGQTATLVLFNGHRVVPVGILSTDPDPDLLPADILETVQVLPDGGSATYGSDAIGGVVNFVTRRRFDGIQLRYERRFAADYGEDTASAIVGKSWRTGGAYLSAVYNRNNEILGRDRDYITSNFTAKGGGDYRSNACGYGQFTVAGKVYAAPSFAPVASAPLCDPTDYTSLAPRQHRWSLFGYAEQEITSNVKFSVDGFYSRRRTEVFRDVASIPATVTITAANPAFRPVAGETSQTVTFNYARGIGPARISPQTFSQYEFVPNLTWRISDDWQVKAEALYGRSRGTIHDRTGLNGAAVTPLNVNPYDSGLTNQAVLQNLANYELYSRGENGITSGQLIATGSLFRLPGGAVKIAFGGELRRQSLNDSTVTGAIGDLSALARFNSHRTIKAVFAELFAPLISDANGSPLLRQLSLNAAVRYDRYSDFGGTTNPRFGLDYKPFEDLLIRANYQTSFVAPSLADSGNLIDTRFQISQVAPNNYLVFIAGAGQSLKPERGKSFSIGADWSPSVIKGLRVSATYWNTKVNSLVSQALGAYGFPGVTATPFSLCGAGLAGTLTSPSGPCTAAFLNSLQPIYRRIDAGAAPGITRIEDLFLPGRNVVNVIDARRKNFGSEKINGIDFSVSYDMRTGFGKLFGQIAGTYILNKKISPAAGAAYIDYLSGERVVATPRYNIVGSLGAEAGAFDGKVTARHNAGIDIPAGTSVGQSHVKSYTLIDLFLSADLQKIASIKNTLLSVSVQNVFDRDPPYFGARPQAGSLGGFTNGGTLGRTLSLSVLTRF